MRIYVYKEYILHNIYSRKYFRMIHHSQVGRIDNLTTFNYSNPFQSNNMTISYQYHIFFKKVENFTWPYGSEVKKLIKKYYWHNLHSKFYLFYTYNGKNRKHCIMSSSRIFRQWRKGATAVTIAILKDPSIQFYTGYLCFKCAITFLYKQFL